MTTSQQVSAQRFANALYDINLDAQTMTQVLAQINDAGGAIKPVLNFYFNATLANLSNQQIAQKLITNLGIPLSAERIATDYVVAQLDSVSASQKGAKVADILDLYAGLSSDPTFGAAATRWNTEVSAAVSAIEIPPPLTSIRLQVIDTRAVIDQRPPLDNSPYVGFRFKVADASNGTANVVELRSDAIDNAKNYDQLATAFQQAADAALGAGKIAVVIGKDFTVTDTRTGLLATGKEIMLNSQGSLILSTPSGSQWLANGIVPADSGFYTWFQSGVLGTIGFTTADASPRFQIASALDASDLADFSAENVNLYADAITTDVDSNVALIGLSAAALNLITDYPST
jgi:hypothetical protein